MNGTRAEKHADEVKLHRLRTGIAASDRLFCVLTPRNGPDDFGTRIVLTPQEFEQQQDASRCSFVEMELLIAITLRKPIHLFFTSDFTPGPRLDEFLKFIQLQLPSAQIHLLATSDSLLSVVQDLIHEYQRGNLIDLPPLPSSIFTPTCGV